MRNLNVCTCPMMKAPYAILIFALKYSYFWVFNDVVASSDCYYLRILRDYFQRVWKEGVCVVPSFRGSIPRSDCRNWGKLRKSLVMTAGLGNRFERGSTDPTGGVQCLCKDKGQISGDLTSRIFVMALHSGGSLTGNIVWNYLSDDYCFLDVTSYNLV